jgi:hypothetical protein
LEDYNISSYYWLDIKNFKFSLISFHNISRRYDKIPLMTETIRLYHGTDTSRKFTLVIHEGDLFGMRYYKKPNFSGTLTNDRNFAEISAEGYSALTPGERPLILVYEIPENEIIDEGPVGNYSEGTFHAFSTTHVVSPEDLPDSYIEALGITKEEAVRRVNDGEISFFRVPAEYQVSHETLEPMIDFDNMF